MDGGGRTASGTAVESNAGAVAEQFFCRHRWSLDREWREYLYGDWSRQKKPRTLPQSLETDTRCRTLVVHHASVTLRVGMIEAEIADERDNPVW